MYRLSISEGHAWTTLERLAQDTKRWRREIVDGLCSDKHPRFNKRPHTNKHPSPRFLSSPPPTSPSPHSISDAILNKCPGTHSKEKEKGITILIFKRIWVWKSGNDLLTQKCTCIALLCCKGGSLIYVFHIFTTYFPQFPFKTYNFKFQSQIFPIPKPHVMFRVWLEWNRRRDFIIEYNSNFEETRRPYRQS